MLGYSGGGESNPSPPLPLQSNSLIVINHKNYSYDYLALVLCPLSGVLKLNKRKYLGEALYLRERISPNFQAKIIRPTQFGPVVKLLSNSGLHNYG